MDDRPGNLYVETVVGYTGPISSNAFTNLDAIIGIYVCSQFDKATRAAWKEDHVQVVKFPDTPIQLTDNVTLTPNDIEVSLRKFQKYRVNSKADLVQSVFNGKHPLHIALARDQFFELEKLVESLLETSKKPTGRIFPEKRAKETLLECRKLTAHAEAFAILDATCEPIPAENIHKRPKIKAEMRSPRGWECYTTDKPEKFIAVIYLTATEKLLGVTPLLDQWAEIFKKNSFRCALSVYMSETNHQVLQVEYDLASLRKLNTEEMSRHVNNFIVRTKIPTFHPTQKPGEIIHIPHTFTPKDMLVLKFVLSQPHHSTNDLDIHLFQFGHRDCLKIKNGDLTITYAEIRETFHQLRTAFRVELIDYMQRILDVLNAEKTESRKRKVFLQCAQSDMCDIFMKRLLESYESLCTDLSSVMVLSTQQLNMLKPLVVNLGEVIQDHAKTNFPDRRKLANATEIFEILDQLSEPIPAKNIYLRIPKNRSARGWECYTTDDPNIFVATLYFTGITSIKYLATLFQSHDIPAEILSVAANPQNRNESYSTLAIAFDIRSLRSLDIATLRREIEGFVQNKPVAASGAPHATQYGPAAANRTVQAQPPKPEKVSQQKKNSRK